MTRTREPRAAARSAARRELAFERLVLLPPMRAPSRRSGSCSRTRGRTTQPGWVTFSDNVLRPAPGREAEIELAGPVGDLARRRLECSRLGRSRPTARPSTASASTARASPTKARSPSTQGSASSSRCRRRATRNGSSPECSTARTGSARARGSIRASRRGAIDIERMESDSWSFRADRCSTPAVFANGRGLLTSEVSPLGQAGVGFAWRDGPAVVWLDFPYREEPLRYDGSETPAAAGRPDPSLAAGASRRARRSRGRS